MPMFLEKSYRGNNRWFLYVITLVVMFFAIQFASIPAIIYSNWGNWTEILSGDAAPIITSNTNTGLALLLFTYMAGFFALFFCVRHIHRKTWTDISTGRNKLDLKRVFFGAAVWGILTIISLLAQFFLGNSSTLIFQFDPLRFLGMLLVVLIFIPFQVAWEEYLFRGYLMQGFTLLFKVRVMPWLLTGIIFGLLHGTNPEVAEFGFWKVMPQYIIMGLLMGFVTIKDDGLELALGLHLVNNILSAILVTHDASALQTHALFRETAPTASHWDTVIMLGCSLIFILVCNLRYRFMHQNKLMEQVEKPRELYPELLSSEEEHLS